MADSDFGFAGRYRETERRAFGDGRSAEEGEGATDPAQILQGLDMDLVAFRGCIQSIGTQFDSQDNRAELRRIRSSIKEKISSCETKLKIVKKKSRDPQSKIQFNQLSRQLESQLTTFQELLESEKKATRQHSHIDLGGDAADVRYTGGASGSLLQDQTQVSGRDGLVTREQEAAELQDLERDILDLRDIQQDLGGLVHDQGDDINQIDKNVYKAGDRVSEGLKQTEKAVVLKKKNRKLQLIIAGVIIGVILIVIIVAAILIGVLVPQFS